jgi:hypothetical protein
MTATKSLANLNLQLYDANGQSIYQQSYGIMNRGTMVQLFPPGLPKGIYFLQIQIKQVKTVVKLIHQ